MIFSELIDIPHSAAEYLHVKCPTCGVGINQACGEVFDDPDGIGESGISWGEKLVKFINPDWIKQRNRISNVISPILPSQFFLGGFYPFHHPYCPLFLITFNANQGIHNKDRPEK